MTTDRDVTAAEESGYVTFTANLYERKGSDKAAVALLEGQNISRVKLKEQGPIVNAWDLAGEGTTWGADRLTSHAEDTASIATYGLREASQVYSDTKQATTLDETAANLLAESAYPRNILTLEATNLAPALYADYDTGDAVQVVLYSYGFGGYEHMVKVETREYDPGSGACTLVVEEAD